MLRLIPDGGVVYCPKEPMPEAPPLEPLPPVRELELLELLLCCPLRCCKTLFWLLRLV